MKRVFISIIGVMASVLLMAQDKLTFKGVAIDGHIDDVVSQLKNKGFEKVSGKKDSDWITLCGSAAGIPDCRVDVFCTPETKQVYKLWVTFPEHLSSDAKKEARSRFMGLYNGLCKKYGQAQEVYGLMKGGTPKAVWKTDDTTMTLEVSIECDISAHVVLVYESIKNSKLYYYEKELELDPEEIIIEDL